MFYHILFTVNIHSSKCTERRNSLICEFDRAPGGVTRVITLSPL